MTRLTAFLAELKRRRVYNVGVVYAAGAFVAAQAADIFLPRLGLPDWTVTLVVVLAVAGFPVALILAWTFDITPAGVRRTAAEKDGPPPAPAGRWRATGGVALATLVLVAGGWWLSTIALGPSSPGPPIATGSDAAKVAADPRSVAVLPFENLSGSPEDAALALGVAESVLHQLANVRAITTIARTSSFAFTGRHEDVRAIGQALNARYLLEGSVQSDGDRLRITAQLIEAAASRSVWSMRFDRRREDIFAVQDDIALQVARALELTLDEPTTEKLTGQGTADFNAYLAFVQGRALLSTLRLADLPSAITYLERAINHDPAFASAYVALAEAEVLLAEYAAGDDRSARFKTALERGETLVAKAIELDDQSGEAYIQRAFLRAYTDIRDAEADFRRGIELQPNNARGYEGLAAVLYQDPARIDDAQQMLQRARELDPVEPRHDVTMSILLAYGRSDFAAAERALLSALRKDPLYQPALAKLAEVHWGRGEFAEGARYGEQALSLDPHSDWTRRILLRIYLDLGDLAAATRIAEGATHSTSAHFVPLHLYAREWERAAEGAYASIAASVVIPLDAILAVAAIRMHARATGDHARAIATLASWSGTTWDEAGRPVSRETSGMKEVTIGLADLMQHSGDEAGARHLLSAVLADMDDEAHELGRGDVWHLKTRPIAHALLGETEAAMALLERSVTSSLAFHDGWYYLEVEPAYASLRADPRFQTLLATVRANLTAQREKLAVMRRDQVVPDH
jgi:TolB-like protein/Tfp pilus assembly protein PilF